MAGNANVGSFIGIPRSGKGGSGNDGSFGRGNAGGRGIAGNVNVGSLMGIPRSGKGGNGNDGNLGRGNAGGRGMAGNSNVGNLQRLISVKSSSWLLECQLAQGGQGEWHWLREPAVSDHRATPLGTLPWSHR